MKKLIFLIGFLISTYTWAAKDSAPINLPGGELKPKGELLISLANVDLLPGSNYKIICTIANPNWNKRNPIIIKIEATSKENSMNGSVISPGNFVVLNQQINQFRGIINTFNAFPVPGQQEQFVRFISLDDSDTATIRSCVLDYAVG